MRNYHLAGPPVYINHTRDLTHLHITTARSALLSSSLMHRQEEEHAATALAAVVEHDQVLPGPRSTSITRPYCCPLFSLSLPLCCTSVITVNSRVFPLLSVHRKRTSEIRRRGGRDRAAAEFAVAVSCTPEPRRPHHRIPHAAGPLRHHQHP